jgi:hypothetical protein
VRQGLVQAGLILTLVELVKSPIEEITGLAGPDREIARAHIEQMQRVVAAIGDAATICGLCSIIARRNGSVIR